ncbi:hypothetical protein [Glycomyces sp. NPDC048151]|uniref:hypothetical protein n=1 Tax=Glycomyces sp. NPDC048151 TaxID=3364002 RepID=UPI00371FBED8
MAHSTLRENRRSATHQLTAVRNQARAMVLVQEPFYQHDHLGPGAPLREIAGSGEQAGYYDWAGRRLFLADGEPDPMCPGAYRYQHNPDCCDLEAPDSDPRSPRYEPMHLRHKPGDTWIIDNNRPHDPYDPGPFGSPGWYKDERTGRHRRDETPDPLPAEGWVQPKGAWFPGTADWPEPAAPQDDQERAAEDGSGERGGSDRPPPWGSRGRPVPSEPDEPETPQGSWRARAGRQSPSPDADARSARRPWDRGESDGGGPGDTGWISGYGGCQTGTAGTAEGEYRFSKLREDAFDRFMVQSAQLRAAHFQPDKPYLRERVAWGLRWLLWVFALGLVSMPAPLYPGRVRSDSAAVQAIPTQMQAESRARAAEPGAGLVARSGLRSRAESAGTTRARRDGRSVTEPPRPSVPDPGPGPVKVPVKVPEPAYRPGAAIAAAVGGARAARKVIAARESRTEHDLARAVRNSAARRPSPRPYMATWEHAFDANATFILGGAA